MRYFTDPIKTWDIMRMRKQRVPGHHFGEGVAWEQGYYVTECNSASRPSIS